MYYFVEYTVNENKLHKELKSKSEIALFKKVKDRYKDQYHGSNFKYDSVTKEIHVLTSPRNFALGYLLESSDI